MKKLIPLLLLFTSLGCVPPKPISTTTPCVMQWTKTDKPYLTKIYYSTANTTQEVTVDPYINIYQLALPCDTTYHFTATHVYKNMESVPTKPLRWHSPKCGEMP